VRHGRQPHTTRSWRRRATCAASKPWHTARPDGDDRLLAGVCSPEVPEPQPAGTRPSTDTQHLAMEPDRHITPRVRAAVDHDNVEAAIRGQVSERHAIGQGQTFSW
jgi:hypothetical protein